MAARPKDMPDHLNYKGEPRLRKKKAEIDVDELEKLAKLHLTNAEIAEWFGCEAQTLYNPEYQHIIQRGKSLTKQRLKQKAIQRALVDNSDTMLIFCLKNYCGWGDNKLGSGEQQADNNSGFTITVMKNKTDEAS